MGNTLAQNEINSHISSLSESVQNSTTSCRAVVNQTNAIVIENVNNVNLSGLNLSSGNYFLFNPKCTGSANQTAVLNNSISQSVSQIATAISQNLDLNPGSTEANQIVNDLIGLKQVATNNIIQQCLVDSVQTNIVDITTGKNINLHGAIINWNNTTDDISTCIFNQFQSSSLTSQITSDISETATSKVEDSIGLILIVAAIIAAIVFMLWIGGTLEIVLIILIIVAILLVIYLIVAKIKKWWPFTVKTKACTGSNCPTAATGATEAQAMFVQNLTKQRVIGPGKLRQA
jgi:ABC-type multidrug transport system fused ATPase/permease subunit